MDVDEKLSDLIDRSYLFRGLEDNVRAEIKAAASRAWFGAGDVMIGEGEAGRDLLLIESGEIEVSTVMVGGEIQLAELGPGAVIGEVAALTDAKRTSTVKARTEVEAVAVPGSLLRQLAQQHADLQALLERLIEGRALHTISMIPE